MVTYTTSQAELTAVANAIRTKGGTVATLAFPQEFVDAIDNIPVSCTSENLTGVLISGDDYRLESDVT